MNKLGILLVLTMLLGGCATPASDIIEATVMATIEPTTTLVPTATIWPSRTPVVDNAAFKAMATTVTIEDLRNNREDYHRQIIRLDFQVNNETAVHVLSAADGGPVFSFFVPYYDGQSSPLLEVQCGLNTPKCYDSGLFQLVNAGRAITVWGEFSSYGADIDFLWTAIIELSPEGILRATQQAEQRELTPLDLTLDFLVIEKQCFGSAGCIIVIVPRLSIDWSGVEKSLDKSYLVVYEVYGSEYGTLTFNLTIKGDQYLVKEHRISTASQDDELTIRIVEFGPWN